MDSLETESQLPEFEIVRAKELQKYLQRDLCFYRLLLGFKTSKGL